MNIENKKGTKRCKHCSRFEQRTQAYGVCTMKSGDKFIASLDMTPCSEFIDKIVVTEDKDISNG